MAYPVARQLLHAPGVRLAAEVGEDDDVGHLADPAERLDRAGDQGLAVHLASKEGFEQDPPLIHVQRLARRRPASSRR